MTNEELKNKQEAIKLIKLPESERPNNVQWIKGKHEGWSDRIRVIFGDIAVCFQKTNNRLTYLGEYPK